MTNTKKTFYFLLSAMILSVSAACAESSNTNNQIPFSNVIFFGDSLSDISNGPESLTLSGDDTGSGLFTNTYVPISNPVDTASDWILPHTGLRFPPQDGDSVLYKTTLPPQLQLCEKGSCADRESQSLNWVEYFVYNAVLREVIAPGADLRPWVIQYTQDKDDVGLHQSVDYAFYSALSGNECGDFDLNPVSCRFSGLLLEASIFAKQLIYRNGQSKVDPDWNRNLREKVIIPGLGKQIKMFSRDKDKGRVMVDDNTLYVVYIGANDLSNAFFDWVDGVTTFEQFLAALTITIPGKIASKGYPRSGVNRLIQLGAKKIRVLGQYNIGSSPEIFTDAGVDTLAEKHALAAALGELIVMYNYALQNFVSKYADDSGVDVEYVDLQSPMEKVTNQLLSVQRGNRLALRQGYFFSIGDRCISAVQPLIEAGKAASCFSQENYISGAPIGFWNDAHLSTQYYQVIASALLDHFAGKTEEVESWRFLLALKRLGKVEEIITRLFNLE